MDKLSTLNYILIHEQLEDICKEGALSVVVPMLMFTQV